MKRLTLALLVVSGSCLVGCEFARGFRDEGLRQGASIGADLAADKLGKDFDELTDVLKDLPSKLPGSNPVEGGALYSAGTLLALLIANATRGVIRQKLEKEKEKGEA